MMDIQTQHLKARIEASDSIDLAFQNLQTLVSEIGTYVSTVNSESDTRLKIIDRILTEVLGWELGDITTSERAGTGFTDYVLKLSASSRLILEAKKDGVGFGLQRRQSGQAFKLNGPVFEDEAEKAINQAIIYNAYKNAELACVSNGNEWIVFRANRLGDGRDTMEGKAFIFSSLQEIVNNFRSFYDLLSMPAVEDLRYRGLFEEVEGLPIRDLSFFESLRDPESRHFLERGTFAADFDAIMASFFQRLKGDDDPDMIRECFVVTPESDAAERTLSRIAEDVVTRLQGLDIGTGEQLVDLIKAVQMQQRNRFVLLVGNKGDGKSTFLDRFFKSVLPNEISDQLVTIRLDLSDSEGASDRIVPWLNDHLLSTIESIVFSDESRDWDDVVGAVYFSEYQRWSKVTMSHLYQTDKNQFKIEFGRHIEDLRKNNPHDVIKRLLDDIVKSRKKVPCIILDNTDHFTIEFQEAVFQYARSVYENNLSIFIIPITDKTSWQLSKQGALQSFESVALYLPVPSTKKVIERRINFILNKLASEDDGQRREYFLGRGIRLDVKNITAFAVSINEIFVNTQSTSEILSGLSNFDIRRMLELTRDVISSPHLSIEEMLKAYITETTFTVPKWKIRTAIIKQRYDIYPVGKHAFVQNVFALINQPPSTPLLGLRILQFLRDSQLRVAEGDRTFVPLSSIYDFFLNIGIHARTVEPWLEELLRTGLILDYDPTVKDIVESSKFEISPSGKVHLIWGSSDQDYVQAMKEITPLRDKQSFDRLKMSRDSWSESLIAFIDYLMEEDDRWCEIPNHRRFEGQKSVPKRLRNLRDRIAAYDPSLGNQPILRLKRELDHQ